MHDTVEPLDLADPASAGKVRAFLAPYEIEALFLIGNLGSMKAAEQRLYVAQADGAWTGIAGYYPNAKSMVAFGLPGRRQPTVAALARAVADRHAELEWCLGPMAMASASLQPLLERGYRVVNDPRQVFMEMRGLPPPQPHQEAVRWVQAGDEDRLIRLLRWLRAGSDDGRPIDAAERQAYAMNPSRVVLAIDGRLVSTAASNGLAITACQILGVATDPAQRGRGYAGAVVAGLMQRMAAQGARHTVLFTRHDNTPAIRCYQKLGFTITGDYLLAKLAPPAAAGR